MATKEKRSSYNPHFTAENRLRPEYEERKPRGERSFERAERGEHSFNRTERTERGERNFNRGERTERSFNRPERGERTERSFNREDNRRPKSGARPATSERRSDNRSGVKRSFAPKRDEKPRSYPKYNPNRVTGEVRLNRSISQSGVCSRREADELSLLVL